VIRIKYAFVLLAIGCPSYSRAAAQNPRVFSDALYWIRYYNQLTLSQKWAWHNEVDNRTFFENNRHQHLIAHTRVHYALGPRTSLAWGLTYSLQDVQSPQAPATASVPEWRPVQEISHMHPLAKRWQLHHRFRIDERFFRNSQNGQLTEGYRFNWRFRYRIQLSYQLIPLQPSGQYLTAKVSDELMLNAGREINQHFDQNRVYAALEYGLSASFAAEVGYLWWYQQRLGNLEVYDREILRLTLYHRLRW
jgi:Protein of unknown function (DUF2490)